MHFKEKGLFRCEKNPLITPADYPGAAAVFNCGQTMYKGQTILLCAIVPYNGGSPFIHVARSDDGINFKFDEKPFIMQSKLPHIKELDYWPIDPRVTYFPEEDVYYIMRPGNSDAGCVAFLGKTHDFVTYEDIDVIALPNNRVPSLFPEKINEMYYRLDRPYVFVSDPHNINQRAFIWVSESPDLIHWGRHRVLLKPWANWNAIKIGPTPPIKTDEGWLEIIHGVTGSCSGQRYSLGAILLDLNDPTNVIGRCDEPILCPDREYECAGKAPNVVFACGAIADLDQDRLRVYYGAADTSICLATGSISDIIAMCKNGR